MDIPKHLAAHCQRAKVVTGLKHDAAQDSLYFEPHGTHAHVAHFPHPGVICAFKLGSAGLQYQRGDLLAAIPLQELIDLFERVDPKFAEAPKPAQRAAQAAPNQSPSKVAAQSSSNVLGASCPEIKPKQ